MSSERASRTAFVGLLLVATVAGCTGSSSKEPTAAAPAVNADAAAPSATIDAMPEPTMPVIHAAADVAAHLDAQVEVHGTYAVVSTGRHKIMYERADGSTGSTNKVVRLELDGGSLDLWVRPEDEQAALTGKKVIAVGKLVGPKGGVAGAAAPDARPSLVDIASVTAE